MEPSEGTLKALKEEDEESEDDGEGEDEGTAKVAGQVRPAPEPPSTPPPPADGKERFGSVTSSRLSNMFDGWLGSSSPTPSSPPSNRNSAIRITNNRLSVSEPRLVEQHTGSSVLSGTMVEDSEDEGFDTAFEHLLVRSV
jgi:hypothetical protein